MGLLSTVTLNRYTLGFLTDCILGHSVEKTKTALESMWFVTADYDFSRTVLYGNPWVSQKIHHR
ncbi:hypothetical protein [Candidatus Kuenenia stuttgartiensis]|uniref:hypothetical protein n=1 Tax=Kuenenia stuttgartiensis TaxID=174633 RepID=UPI00146B20BC|nr:hypothetical protein [Candidatus Kuenenia stuttgartiensis]